MRLATVLLFALAACSPSEDASVNGAPQVDLERAAIAAGIVRDPGDTDITGLYSRDTDRVCIVPEIVGYSIGASIDYGGGVGCSGQGTVTRSGETLHVEFKNVAGCSFDARFDGERIDFPGRLPESCAKLCSDRASFAALEADLLSDSIAEATTLRDGRGKMLCRNDG